MFLVVCEVSLFFIFSFCWKILLFSVLGDPRLAFWPKKSRFFRALVIAHDSNAFDHVSISCLEYNVPILYPT